jgi:HTH-type transcriptional regulator/antitoxin HipB
MQDKITIVSSADLGRVVRAVRVASGLTQADAAALCGVSAPFLNGLERGKPTAQVGLVLAVCRGLGIGLVAGLPDPLDLSSVPRRAPVRAR